jgi:hypothetical protein
VRKSWTAVAILVLWSAACTRSSEPLAIHEPSKILYVEVIHWQEDGGRGPLGEYTIEDRKRIESVIALLRSNNTGYREDRDWARWKLFETKSRTEYTVIFNESLDTPAPLAVSIGSDWLSGNDDQDDRGRSFYRTRPLSGSERKDLLSLLARRPEDRDSCCG